MSIDWLFLNICAGTSQRAASPKELVEHQTYCVHWGWNSAGADRMDPSHRQIKFKLIKR
jgi:hypothetical protein